MKRILLFGASGSIGASTLDIVRSQDGRFSLVGLSVHRSCDRLAAWIEEFAPQRILISDPAAHREWAAAHPEHASRLLPAGAGPAELLELPAGTLDPPESPLECARRELAEETGYRAGRLAPLLSFYSTPGICDEQMHVFTAHDLTSGPPAPEAGEQIRVVSMTTDEALAAIGDQRIVDGKPIAALLYYNQFVRENGNG